MNCFQGRTPTFHPIFNLLSYKTKSHHHLKLQVSPKLFQSENSDVTSGCNTIGNYTYICFISFVQMTGVCRMTSLFTPEIVWWVQVLLFSNAISHSVTHNLDLASFTGPVDA